MPGPFGARIRHTRAVDSAGDQQIFSEGTKVTRPLGWFILWAELPKTVNAMRLYQKALDVKISIVPGPVFSAKQRYQDFIRLSCGYPWSVELEQTLATLGRLARAI